MASDRSDPHSALRCGAPQASAFCARRRHHIRGDRPCLLCSDPPSGREPHLRGRERTDCGMSAGLKVLSQGLYTTVQDLGRIGYQDIGVPVSGALDGVSLRLANALVGNPPEMAALEILVSGPTLEIAADAVRVALVGPGASLLIGGAVRAAGQSITLSRGEVFQIVVDRQSACCYLAAEGGIAVPLILGSASTYVRAGIGGLEGRLLRRDDFLPLGIERAPKRVELWLPTPLDAARDQPIRVILGPQQECFTEEAVTVLLSAALRVSNNTAPLGI